MKQTALLLLFVLALTIISIAAMAQTTKPAATAKPADTVKKAVIPPYVDAPGKVFEITLRGDISAISLMKFAFTNAPLLETNTPANQLKGLGAKLNEWLDALAIQLREQHTADSIKASKPVPKK